MDAMLDITKNVILKCPKCGSENTHLESVSLYNATDGENRMSAKLTFYCEDDHRFTMDVHQHEGTTFIREVE